jgi:drug/metabolite transporter (DMT)-like permease
MTQEYRRATLIGLGFVLITAFGWGLNWPATKFLLTDCPPLSARGISGIVASLGLAALATFRGESIAVPPALRWRLVLSGLLNVSAWMGLTTASLLWLNAGEAATLAYTMPVWAALFAWPVLGERPDTRKIMALVLGVGGVVVLVGGSSVRIDVTKLPGVASALTASFLFALGTVLSKRFPVALPPTSLTAWQVGIGCIPLLVGALVFEHPHFGNLPMIGWGALAYTAAISLGLCYLTWFAALRRLKAGTAAIATLLTPVIGVAASAVVLGEPLLWPQLTALGLILCGIILSIRGDAPKSLDRPAQTSKSLA